MINDFDKWYAFGFFDMDIGLPLKLCSSSMIQSYSCLNLEVKRKKMRNWNEKWHFFHFLFDIALFWNYAKFLHSLNINLLHFFPLRCLLSWYLSCFKTKCIQFGGLLTWMPPLKQLSCGFAISLLFQAPA